MIAVFNRRFWHH